VEVHKTQAALRLNLVRLNRSINDELVPKLAAVLTDTDDLSRQAAGNLNDAARQLQPSLQNLSRASAAAADAMSDPHIRETLANVDTASAGVAGASQRLNASMANVDGMTADGKRVTDYYAKKLTTPEGFWKAVLSFVLQAGSQARILLGK
jgi:ABC-type transporter Mla subunit MlaD